MNPALLLAAAFAAFSSLVYSEETETADQWIKNAGQWAELREGKVVLLDSETSNGAQAGYSATAAILVDSPIAAVWKVVDDGDAAADFQDSLISSKILERSDSFTLIEQIVKVGFHKVKYVVRQNPRPPCLIDFELESGNLKEMDGFWRFLPVESAEGRKTLLVYRLSLKPAIPIPGFVIQKSIAKNLPGTLRSVRDETIRRSGSS